MEWPLRGSVGRKQSQGSAHVSLGPPTVGKVRAKAVPAVGRWLGQMLRVLAFVWPLTWLGAGLEQDPSHSWENWVVSHHLSKLQFS